MNLQRLTDFTAIYIFVCTSWDWIEPQSKLTL